MQNESSDGPQQPQRRRQPHGLGQSSPLTTLDATDSLWNRAAAVSENGDPFCCRTEWQLSFHETVRPLRAVHVEQSGDSLAALAETQHPQVGPVLEPLESSWMFGCPMLGPDGLAMLTRLVQRSAAQFERPPHVLVSGIRSGSSLLPRLLLTFADEFHILDVQNERLRMASLEGGLDGYLARRRGRLRRDLRTRQRRAQQDGITFERLAPRTPIESDRVFARMLDIESRSWKGLALCGMNESSASGFYRLLLRRLAIGGLSRIILAQHDGKDIGFIFGGLVSGIYRGQQFSFDDEWRESSLGNVMQIEKLRWLCEDGAHRYDMGPAMEYKRHWTESEAEIHTLLLKPR